MKSLCGICMNLQFFLVHIFSHMGYQLDKKKPEFEHFYAMSITDNLFLCLT